MKIGDKIVCSNGHTYTLAEGDEDYTFSLIDEFGEVINKVQDYHLEDCLRSDEEELIELCVGNDYLRRLKYTRTLELIEV